MESLSLTQARRTALAAQGFGRRRPLTVTRRHLVEVLDRVGIVQIDSVNVVTRSHYLPFYSRLGPYDPAELDALRDGRSRAGRRIPHGAVEYWAHEAALISPSLWPSFGFRMRRAHDESWGGMQRVKRDHPDLVQAVFEEITRRGPLTVPEIEVALDHDAPRARDNWGWNWSLVKCAAEQLFWAGEVTSAGRTRGFARRYAPLDSVLPPEVIERAPAGAQAVPEEDAFVTLVELAARAHGVATAGDLRDYARLTPAQATPAIERLRQEGVLVPVQVQSWRHPAFLHRDARVPTRLRARALLSPFDSLVWTRPRVAALFGMDYRLEIYTPAAKRLHGYYVLPFLCGDRLVARVDLKADRSAYGGEGALRVVKTTYEPTAKPGDRDELAAELTDLAAFLRLSRVTTSLSA